MRLGQGNGSAFQVFRRRAVPGGRRTFPGLSSRFRVFALAVVLASAGCKAKPKFAVNTLPLPPAADSGIYDGQFVQVDYGFGIPVPKGWRSVRLSVEEQVDEVARFAGPYPNLILRMGVELGDPAEKLTAAGWSQKARQGLEDDQLKVLKAGEAREWKTGGPETWLALPLQIQDSRGVDWADQDWALKKGDMLIEVHVLVPQKLADRAEGKTFFKEAEGALTQIHWYTPIGSRGISVERFELRQFTEGFCGALESRSVTKVDSFFDDMYPSLSQWNAWYLEAVSGDPKTFTLKSALAGLVINGDNATASFTLVRQNAGGTKPEKFVKDFKLSKKQGSWKIIASVQKRR